MNVLSVLASHDASIAYFVDNKLEYFLKEERLSGIKRDSGVVKGLNYIIKNDLEVHAVIINSCVVNDPYIEDTLAPWMQKAFDCQIYINDKEHHKSHAILSFEKSKFDESIVFVIDRNGTQDEKIFEVESIIYIDKEYNTQDIYKNFGIEKLYDLDIHNKLKEYRCDLRCDSSMGITQLYETATTLIGQGVHENGKIMGLSSYGRDLNFKNFFNDGVVDSQLFFKNYDGYDEAFYIKEFYDKKTDNISEDNYQFYADYAFQVQKQTQEEILRLVQKYVAKTGIKKVCFAGGYALNVVTNSFLVKSLPHVEFYFEPISDDTGITLGSSLIFHKKMLGIIPQIPYHTFFNNINHDIDKIEGENVSEEDIARFLSHGKTVAVFNGQSEVGPRALGNRSLLYDARDPDAKKVVNKIKNREWYRPFAAVVLEKDAKDYFEMYNIKCCPEMTLSFPVKSKKIPGVTHVDNTCRIQTVDKNTLHLYNVLSKFKEITDIPVLLNTSFNLAGKPLIETPQQAIETFKNTDIDILWFPEKSIMLTK